MRRAKRGFSLYVVLVLPLMLALAFSFALLALSLRAILSDVMYTSLDNILSERIEDLRTALDGFETTVSKSERTPARFVKFLSDLVDEQARDAQLSGTIVLIQDVAGNMLAASRHVSVEGLDTLGETPQTLVVTFSNGSFTPMRVRSNLIQAGTSFSVRVSVARNVDLIRVVEERVTSIVIIVFLLGFVVLSAVLLMVARALTLPLARLVRGMKDVNVNNLHEPVSLVSGIRELAELTEQFNRMLTRLDNSFGILSRFVADVAHQLRTPLAVMAGEINISLKESSSKNKLESVMKSNLEEIHRLNHFLNILLNLERLEAGQSSVVRRWVDVRGLVIEVTKDFELVGVNRGVSVEIQNGSELWANVEPDLLRQAIVNLFDNATKYGRNAHNGAAARVLFEIGAGDEKAPEFEVKDFIWIRATNWGPAISKDEIPYLGNRFFRGKTHVSEGFGLGLSLVKLVAELHGGRMDVASSEKEGTSFTIVLKDTGRGDN